MPVLQSYRNQSIDLQSKSIDWFLYEGSTGIQWVKFGKNCLQRESTSSRVLGTYSKVQVCK